MEADIDEHIEYAEGYKIHCLLGDGGQANVYLGSKQNQLYALKVYLPGESKQEAFRTEVEFLNRLSFPHLINMVDHHPRANVKLHGKAVEKRPLLVMELAEGGELFEFIFKQGRFSPQICSTYTNQLINTIKYLADAGVSHRDIKPQNILFDKDFQIKVADFGLSRDAKGDMQDYRLYSRVGTNGYKPPEMEFGNYTGLQADIFAVGVVLFIMYTKTPPFFCTKTHDKIYNLIRKEDYTKFWRLHQRNKPPDFFPDSLKRLMNSFFSANVDKRPTFKSLHDDEWLNRYQVKKHQIKKYMQDKYDRIAETDPIKQQIAAVKQQLYLNYIMEEERYLSSQSHRKHSFLNKTVLVKIPGQLEDSPEPLLLRYQKKVQNIEDINQFISNYQKHTILTKQLPQFQKRKVVYVNQNASFVVAWLKDWLKEQLTNKQVFLEQFAQEISPFSFELAYCPDHFGLDLTFVFDLDKDSRQELKLKGKLHRNNKEKIGVDWEKVSGNLFWLSSIEARLNETLQTIV